MQKENILTRWLDRQLSSSVYTWQEILRMLVPFILDSMSIFFIGMLITALISKNGDSSVAAVSLVNPITNLAVCIFNGIGTGGTVVVAQASGTGNGQLLRRAIGHVLFLTVAVGLVACVPFILLAAPVIQVLYPSAEAEVLTKAAMFFQGCLISVIPFTLYTAVFSVLRGLGESRKCVILSVIINGAYLLFSILFLNVMNLDIQGSVIALILARGVGALCAVALLLWIKAPVTLKRSDVFTLEKGLVRRVLKVSIPLSMEQIFNSCGGVVAEIYMATLGTAALAAHAAANSMLGVLLAPAYAAASLSVTTVGKCIGAGKPDEAKRYGNISVVVGTVLIAIMALFFYPLIPVLLRQYNPTAATVASVTRILWICLPVVLIFWSASNTTPSSLRAANDTNFPSVYSLAVMWAVNIGLGWVLAIPAGLGLLGVWIAIWTAWAVRCIGFTIRYYRISWN